MDKKLPVTDNYVHETVYFAMQPLKEYYSAVT